MSDTGALANKFASGVLEILDYTNTAKNTIVKSFNGQVSGTTDLYVIQTTGSFIDTSAITKLSIVTSRTLNAGSEFSLYGIRGS
jgi:hypothetical protein